MEFEEEELYGEGEESQFRQPTFEESQRISVMGRELDPRDKKDKVLLKMHQTFKNEFEMEDAEIQPLLERASDFDDLQYYNGVYLAGAMFYSKRHSVTTKKSIVDFVETYGAIVPSCASLIRYVSIVSS